MVINSRRLQKKGFLSDSQFRQGDRGGLGDLHPPLKSFLGGLGFVGVGSVAV